MSRKSTRVFCLMIGSLAGAAAWAQQPTGGTAPGSTQDTEALQEVVVTATRHEESIHDIPLSVSAVTGQTMGEQGIKTAADLDELVAGCTSARAIAAALQGSSLSRRSPSGASARRAPALRRPASTSTTYRCNSAILSASSPAVPFSRTCSTWIASRCYAGRRERSTVGPPRAARSASSRLSRASRPTRPTLWSKGHRRSTAIRTPRAVSCSGGLWFDDVLAGRLSVWYRHEGGDIRPPLAVHGDVPPGR